MSTQFPAFNATDIPPDVRIAVAAARFNAAIVDELLTGCLRRLGARGYSLARALQAARARVLAHATHQNRMAGVVGWARPTAFEPFMTLQAADKAISLRQGFPPGPRGRFPGDILLRFRRSPLEFLS